MANVHVVVTNPSGRTVGLTMDEGDSRIEYLRKLVTREELVKVDVKPVGRTPTRAGK